MLKNDLFTPIVSVVIPVFNGARYIEDTILSVTNQTMHEIEVIVVDDCSHDDTVLLVHKLQKSDNRVTLLINKNNEGVASTRNKGILQAKGKYIAFLDSDDRWHSQKLEKQLELIEKKGSDLCYTSYRFIDYDGNVIGKEYLVPPVVNYSALLRENVIGCSTVLIKAEVMRGFFMDDHFAHEDYVLWLELLRAGITAAGVLEVLVDYRIGGRSSDKLLAAKNRWLVYRKSQKLSFWKSCRFFCSYVLNAFKKYR